MALLQDTIVFLGAAVVAVPLLKRLGFGALLGYLAAGIAIGPYVLDLISGVESILHFGELGVVLLLFIIGLELNPARLWALRRPIFGLGSCQVLISAAGITAAAWLLGLPPTTAVIVGLVLALSSTAFAIQTLAERNELRTQHGRAAFSILLFQDLAVIPLLAVLPWIAHAALQTNVALEMSELTETDWQAIGLSVAAVAVVVIGGRLALRPALRLVAASGVPELFTAAALLVVLGIALIMEAIGLSMALGAFLAGVLLADSQYRHRLEADIEPFKGLLLGLFFIAVGMSMDLARLSETPLAVLGVALGLMSIKFAVLFAIGLASGLRWDAALALAAVIPQGGEFAFVLFGAAISVGAVDRADADFLILAVAVTMALTPLSVGLADRIRAAFSRGRPAAAAPPEIDHDGVRVVIAGFGRFGQIVGRLLNMRGIRFVALDSDNNRIEVARRFGNEAYFGDANRLQVLEAAGTVRAEAFVVAVDDADRAVEIARMVRMHFPDVRIYARAIDRFHAYRLMEVGVNHVFREMFGSSLDMSRALFVGLGIPARKAEAIVRAFRDHDEDLLREQYRLQGDEAAMIRSAREAAIHLAGLFEHDKEIAEETAEDPREAAE